MDTEILLFARVGFLAQLIDGAVRSVSLASRQRGL